MTGETSVDAPRFFQLLLVPLVVSD